MYQIIIELLVLFAFIEVDLLVLLSQLLLINQLVVIGVLIDEVRTRGAVVHKWLMVGDRQLLPKIRRIAHIITVTQHIDLPIENCFLLHRLNLADALEAIQQIDTLWEMHGLAERAISIVEGLVVPICIWILLGLLILTFLVEA